MHFIIFCSSSPRSLHDINAHLFSILYDVWLFKPKVYNMIKQTDIYIFISSTRRFLWRYIQSTSWILSIYLSRRWSRWRQTITSRTDVISKANIWAAVRGNPDSLPQSETGGHGVGGLFTTHRAFPLPKVTLSATIAMRDATDRL